MVDAKQQRRRLVVVATVVGGLMPLGNAYALEFGRLELASGLNQPLDARVPLSALTAGERDSLAVHIAAPAMFKHFHIERGADIDRLRVKIRKSGGQSRVMVHIRTRRPVREPFLDFLLEADSSDGRALREYTVLLDPTPAAPPADKIAAAATARRAAAKPRGAGNTSGPGPAAARGGRYGPVRAGDTLWSIAARRRPAGASIEQTLVAIYRANPKAFSGGIGTLQKGATLAIPTAAGARAVDQGAAEKRIRAAQNKAASAPAGSAATAGAADRPGASDLGRLSRSDFEHLAAIAGALGIASAARAADTPARATAAPADTTAAQKPAARARPAGTRAGAPVGRSAPAGTTAAAGDKTVSDTRPVRAQAHASPTAVPSVKPKQTKTKIDAVAGGERDVAAAGENDLFSPRYLPWLAALVGLVALTAAWWRRRQYKPLPLDIDEGDTAKPDNDEPISDAPRPIAPVAEPEPEPAPALAVAADVAPEPAPALPEPPRPVTAIDAADACLQSGEFSQARARLETALDDEPEDAKLQDKLLEVAYQAGDALRFSEDVARFDRALKTSGLRWANVAAMGRVLLPGDPRFEIEALAAITAGQDESSAAPPPAEDAESEARGSLDPQCQGVDRLPPVQADAGVPTQAPRSDNDPRAAGDHGAPSGLDLDTKAGGLDTDDRPARRPDRGEPDLAFELDAPTAAAGPARPSGPAAAPDASPALEMIDPGDFDLEAEAAQNDQPLDADTIDVRLDLARMYLDMDDPAMARDLLEEAVEKGDSAQRDTARALLASL